MFPFFSPTFKYFIRVELAEYYQKLLFKCPNTPPS